eukprot:scaffold69485_cov63-Phaeocystis_antarctica.AAC.2
MASALGASLSSSPPSDFAPASLRLSSTLCGTKPGASAEALWKEAPQPEQQPAGTSSSASTNSSGLDALLWNSGLRSGPSEPRSNMSSTPSSSSSPKGTSPSFHSLNPGGGSYASSAGAQRKARWRTGSKLGCARSAATAVSALA